jgi:2-methylisocitrate lyase-like PEP mutase family enzyme
VSPPPAGPARLVPGVGEKREAFRQLHASGCFVIPNPWDVGSARYLASLGFPALATTSSGFAWSRGRTDNDVTLEDVLLHLEEVAAGVDVPVNADFEGGFAVEPAGVAANVRRAVAAGVAGISIEDSDRRRVRAASRVRPRRSSTVRARPRRR